MRGNAASGFFLAAVFLGGGLFSAAAAAEIGFSRLVVFGDSLSDSGNGFVVTQHVAVRPYELIPAAPYARGGLHFSNGETWVEQLAGQLRLTNSVGPALRTPGVSSNYAVGGARARVGTVFDLSSQVVMFLGDFGGAAPMDALYIVHIGGNDLRDAIEALASDPSGTTSVAIIGDALNAIANNIITLTSAGARQFLVPNAPNLALVPAVRLQGPQAQAAAQFLSIAFNNALAVLLSNLEAGLPITLHRLDVFTLINEAVALPASVGLTEVKAPCITPGTTADAECTHPDDYLFWDGIHPTRTGHAILARRASAILAVP